MGGHEHEPKQDLGPFTTISHLLSEGGHAAHGIAHDHPGGKIGAGVAQALGGFSEIGTSVGECAEGHYADCAIGGARGIKDVAQGSAGMFESAKAARLGKIAGGVGVGLDVIDAVKAYQEGDYEAMIEHGGAALVGTFAPEVVPAWHAGQAIGGVISRFSDQHTGYTDRVADDALEKYGPLYEHLPAWYVHAMAAPEVLENGATQGLVGAAQGVYSEGKGAARDVLTGVTAIAKYNAMHTPQPVAPAREGHRWNLDNPLAPIGATACYEDDDPHSVMQAFGHWMK